jgi:hypothetical protein
MGCVEMAPPMSRGTVKARITTMARSIGQMARQSECWGIALFVGVIAAMFGGSTAVMLAVGGLAALGLLAAGSSSARQSIADMERARQKRKRRAQRASTIAKWGLPLTPHHQLTTLVDAIAKASPADDTLFELEDLLDYHVSLMVVRHRSMCALASEDAAGNRKSADGRMHCSTTPALATVHALRRDTCFALHQQVIGMIRSSVARPEPGGVHGARASAVRRSGCARSMSPGRDEPGVLRFTARRHVACIVM